MVGGGIHWRMTLVGEGSVGIREKGRKDVAR